MEGQCRDSFGIFNVSVFHVWTCSLCYTYLFPTGELKFNFNTVQPGLVKLTYSERNEISSLDVKSDGYICSTLGDTDCERWKACCQSAVQCCQKQLSQSRDKPSSNDSSKMCPRTWDGWGCFDQTPAGSTVEISCPSYIQYGNLQGYAEKRCTGNGSWIMHSSTGKEWTDYSKCVNIKSFGGVVYASVTASVLSLLLLVPAIAVFTSFRQLRCQHRIQLHMCLFASFVITSVLTIIWELVVYNDRIANPGKHWKETFMFKQQDMCKAFYVLLRYATCTNYFWMFCEGFYLHRLLVLAFQSPRHIRIYFLIGWVGPSIPVIIYSIMRWYYTDDICWIKNAGAFEWVLYTPNLLCILINLCFLLSILRILLTQLHHHPNEPSNYRRALKATFVLVPLFGLQLFFVIYIPSEASWYNVYEIVSKLVIDSQGGVISLIFCYCNGEVLVCIKNALRKLQVLKPKRTSLVTNYTIISPRTRSGLDTDHVESNGCDINSEQIRLTESRHWRR